MCARAATLAPRFALYHEALARQSQAANRLIPTGCATVTIRLVPAGAVITMPAFRTASSLYQRKNSAA